MMPVQRSDRGAADSGRSSPVSAVTTADLVAGAVRGWRDALLDAAGESALSDVERLGEAQLDLSAAHPSGIAQLFAGRPTRLSNLVREGAALAQARRRARAVGALAEDHALRSGLATAFLAIGVASWTDRGDDPEPDPLDALASGVGDTIPRSVDDDTVPREGATPGAERRRLRAPVLLRPVSVTPHGRGEADYDLVLEPSLEINPLLAAALRRRGALLDPTSLARGAFTAQGFDPRPALERLGSLGVAVLDDFELTDRVVVGTFMHPEQMLVDDLEQLAPSLAGHEVIAALCGDQRAAAALAHPLPPALRGDRGLDQERGVGDLDPTQAYVLDAMAAGHHLLVDAPAGSDVPGTLAAVIADAAAAGRRVLYVAGHRRAATAVTGRLAELGLGDLVLDVAPDSGWRGEVARRLLGAMTIEPVLVDGAKVEIVDRELLDRRSRLAAYVEALHTVREPWGCSAYDALQALARLTAQRPSPRTTVRLTAPVAESLTAERRAQAAADLVTVAGLGAFTASTATTAWFGADLPTADRARAALDRVDRLREAVPRMRDTSAEVAEATGLVPPTTPAAWTEQLRMLGGVRQVLDVFQPIAFERSAADMIAATATKQWRAERGVEMAPGVRRRLRRQAKDLLRPGRPVPDLHAALVELHTQREIWQAHCPAGGWPRLPSGLAAIERDHRAVAQDLAALAGVLEPTGAGGDLDGLDWARLAERLDRLHADAGALAALPERTALLRDLAKRGLGDLVADLAERRVAAGVVGAELDLAWWSTAFEEILRQDPAMAAHDGASLSRLVAEFRTLDRRHLSDRALLHVAGSREALRQRLHRCDEQAQALFGEIVEDRFTSLRQAVDRYPDVTRHLRPCLVVGPMLVPHVLPPTRSEDLLILDAAGHLPTELVVGALARARQVVVVADTRCATGSAVHGLAEVLPTVTLSSDAVPRHPRLTGFLAEHGYGRAVAATPLPSTAGLLRLDLVDGTGMPGRDGAVTSTVAEVDHVVATVVEHAVTRPSESLAVVALTAEHADRVREAVLAEVRANPALGGFFAPDAREPFVVVDLAATEALRRDTVLLTVGFGRTPHGRVLHRFGRLGEPGGDARLLEALGAARRRLVVVSSFAGSDLDPERLTSPGPELLRDLLTMVGEPDDAAGEPAAPDGSDRLVLDLAERLWRLGLIVAVEHGTPGGPTVPLAVGHPDLPDELLVAVLTDDDAYLGEPSVRVRDRQVAERLERLGWSVVQVWSAAAFGDPQAEADAIAQVVVEAYAARAARPRTIAPRSVPSGAGTPPAESGAGTPPAGDAAPTPADDGPTTDDAPSSTGDVAPVADDAPQAPAPGGTGQDAAEEAPPEPGTPEQGVLEVPEIVASEPRPLRPDVTAGLPVGAYTDDQLDDLAAWLLTGDVERDEARLAAALRAELGFKRRGSRIDAVVGAAARRALGGR
ncbi:MAG: DNA helicase [Actinomycetales bacterium]|nr:DNA helicase [Actinomycetales bacterium]